MGLPKGYTNAPFVSEFRFLRENEKLRMIIKHKASKYTMRELDDLTGINKALISKYLNGKVPSMNDDDILKLCEFFKISINLNITLN